MKAMLRQDGSHRASAALSQLVPISCGIGFFFLLYFVFFSRLWGDQAFLMYAAKQVLAGTRLDGPRLIETNPPMVVWFSLIPALFSDKLLISPDLALLGTVSALILVSAIWSYALLCRANQRVSPILLATLLAAVEFVIRPALFGQKEQIVVTLLMPYIVACVVPAGCIGQLERFAIGLLAGLAICFKPHHLLAVFALELFLLIYKRSFRSLLRLDQIVASLTECAYAFCVWHFTPYLQDVYPALRDTYWALGDRTSGQLLRHEAAPLTIGLLIIACVLFALRRQVDMLLPAVFTACSAGSTVAFYVQHTGWYYQGFPAKAFLTLAFLSLCLQWAYARTKQPITYINPKWLVWGVALMLPLLVFGIMMARRIKAKPAVSSIDSELECMPEGTTVYAFSIEMSQFHVVLDHHLVWGSRFAHQWMMPAIIQNEYPRQDASRPFKALGAARTEELAAHQRSATAEDLAYWKPKYVFVEKCDGAFYCSLYNHPLNFINWYSQTPAFASEWSHYHLLKTVKNFDLYDRRDD